MRSFSTLQPHIHQCDSFPSQTQVLLRKHRDVLPKKYLNDFEVSRNSSGSANVWLQTVPKLIIENNIGNSTSNQNGSVSDV